MKVISGMLKGRILKGPKNIRPVTAFIKEAIFNILQGIDWNEVNVLDLFAGAGNFGIESISRGAKSVTFVDISGESRKYILENLKGVEWEGEIIQGDFKEVIKKLFKKDKKFNIIFADPPFDKFLGGEIVQCLSKYDLFTENTILVLRLRDKENVMFPENFVVDKRVYGDSVVYIVKSE